VRCKACDRIMQDLDWSLNNDTNDFDELCRACRSKVYAVQPTIEEVDNELQPLDSEDTKETTDQPSTSGNSKRAV
jgi:hypothetical protein